MGQHFDGKDKRTSPIWGKCAENSLGRGHANYLTNYFTVRFRQITGSNSWWFTKKCVLLQAIGGKASPPTASPPARTPSLRPPSLRSPNAPLLTGICPNANARLALLRGEGGSLTPDSLTPDPSPGRGGKPHPQPLPKGRGGTRCEGNSQRFPSPRRGLG